MPSAEAIIIAVRLIVRSASSSLDQVRQDEGDRDRVARGLGDAQAERAQDVAPVGAQDLGQRVLRDVALVLQLLELGGLLDLEPDDDADDDQDRAEQEGHPPRPVAAQGHAGQEGEVGQQQPDREAGLGDAGVETSFAPRRVLEAHEDGPAPLGAEGQALDDADEDEQDPGPHADLVVGGQGADEDGRDAHQQQRADEHRLAADLVAEVAADDPAERPDGEPDAERGEREQGARQRVVGGEEDGVEVQGRGDAEADEVVGLDGGADRGADRDALLGRRALDGVRVLGGRPGRQVARSVRSWWSP